MISIRNSVVELERLDRERTAAVECYRQAIRNAAQYTIELESQITEPQRRYLNSLADSVVDGSLDLLADTQSNFRALLRDYRDKASDYLNRIKEELAGTTRALQETLESLAETDGDHESRLRGTLSNLRETAGSLDLAGLRSSVLDAVAGIEDALQEIRKQHQLATVELQVEIRVLHKRIQALEAASAIDELTRFLNRGEMEQRIRGSTGNFCLVLIRVKGFRLAEVQHDRDVASELAGAFGKRLRNVLPSSATISRWSQEEFAAMVTASKSEAMLLTRKISEQLSGTYSCLQHGKAVRPSLQLTTAVVESIGALPERTLEKVHAFLPGDSAEYVTSA